MKTCRKGGHEYDNERYKQCPMCQKEYQLKYYSRGVYKKTPEQKAVEVPLVSHRVHITPDVVEDLAMLKDEGYDLAELFSTFIKEKAKEINMAYAGFSAKDSK